MTLYPSTPPSTWSSPGRHWEAAKGLPHPELEETIRLHILFQVEDHDDGDDNSDDSDDDDDNGDHDDGDDNSDDDDYSSDDNENYL